MSDQQPEPSPTDSAAGTHRAVLEAFETFAKNEYPRLQIFLIRCGASPEDSDDAAQDAFLDAWKLVAYSPSRWIAIREPCLWVRRVALRALARPRGQNRRQLRTIPLDPDHGGHDQAGHDWAEQVILEADVRAALHCLPETQRHAMAYRMDGFKYAVVAAELGVTEQRARDLIKQARSVLKHALRHHIDEKKDTSDHLGIRSQRRSDD